MLSRGVVYLALVVTVMPGAALDLSVQPRDRVGGGSFARCSFGKDM